MKSKINFFLALVIVATTAIQCKKKKTTEDPTTEPEPVPTGISTIADLFATNGSPFVNFTVSATAPSTITSNGVVIEIPANAFVTNSSGTVTGNVVISVKTILNKSQIILTGAQANSSNAKLVNTKGCVKITASQNSQSLRLSNPTSGTVTVSLPDGTTPLPAAKKYYVSKLSVSDSTKFWAMESDTNDVSVVYTGTNYVQKANLDSLKWLNVGTKWDTLCTKTALSATTTSTVWNKTNCAVYVSLNGSLTVGAMYEISPGLFRISNLPIGKGVHIIAIGVINGQYYEAINSTTVKPATEVLNLVPKSLAQIQADLAALP